MDYFIVLVLGIAIGILIYYLFERKNRRLMAEAYVKGPVVLTNHVKEKLYKYIDKAKDKLKETGL